MARRMLELAREAQKTLAVTVLCTLDEENYLRDTLGVPVFHFPKTRCSPGGDRDWRPGSERPESGGAPPYKNYPKPPALPRRWQAHTPGFLPLAQALTVIAALGIPVAPWAVAVAPKRQRRSRPPGVPGVLKALGPQPDSQNRGRRGELDVHDALRSIRPLPGWPGWPKPPAAGEAWQVVVMSQVAGGRNCFWGPAG